MFEIRLSVFGVKTREHTGLNTDTVNIPPPLKSLLLNWLRVSTPSGHLQGIKNDTNFQCQSNWEL
jgi:hypothetical protein